MSKGARNGDVNSNIVGALDEIESTEDGLWYVLTAGGGWSGGCGDEGGAYVVSRCLMEVVHGHTFDAEGRFVRAPHPAPCRGTATARRVRDRVRQALREGRQAGAEFVICYHVEGDPGWHMEWSEAHSRKSAVEALKQFLRHGMPWEELWE
jgi:hypothetical protein